MSELNTINGARLIIPFAATPPSPLAQTSGDKQPPNKNASASADEQRAGDRFEVSTAGAALAALQESGLQGSGLQGSGNPSNSNASNSNDGIRVAKVARVRSEVQNGIYDLEGKLETVLDRILEDLG